MADTKKVLCKYFMHGACTKGDACPFSHNRKDRPNMVCVFYQRGMCSYGAHCRYDHVKPKGQQQGASQGASKPKAEAPSPPPPLHQGQSRLNSQIQPRLNGAASAVRPDGAQTASASAPAAPASSFSGPRPEASPAALPADLEASFGELRSDPELAALPVDLEESLGGLSISSTSSQAAAQALRAGFGDEAQERQQAAGTFDHHGGWATAYLSERPQAGNSIAQSPSDWATGLYSQGVQPSTDQYDEFNGVVLPSDAYEGSGSDDPNMETYWAWYSSRMTYMQEAYRPDASSVTSALPGSKGSGDVSSEVPDVLPIEGELDAVDEAAWWSETVGLKGYESATAGASFSGGRAQALLENGADLQASATSGPLSALSWRDRIHLEAGGVPAAESGTGMSAEGVFRPAAAPGLPASVDGAASAARARLYTADTPLCSLGTRGACTMGVQCPHVHGDLCPHCQKACLHPHRPEEAEEHMVTCEKNQRKLAAVRRSQEIECSVCLERVLAKPKPSERKFGILSHCDHPHCIACIRGWRSHASSGEATGLDLDNAVRACPVCRVQSHFVTPSVLWYFSPEEKEEIVKGYKNRLSEIDCRHFNFGEGTCPFGTSCFYRHAYRDGRLEEIRLRHLGSADGSTVIAKDVRLSDFIAQARPRTRR